MGSGKVCGTSFSQLELTLLGLPASYPRPPLPEVLLSFFLSETKASGHRDQATSLSVVTYRARRQGGLGDPAVHCVTVSRVARWCDACLRVAITCRGVSLLRPTANSCAGDETTHDLRKIC